MSILGIDVNINQRAQGHRCEWDLSLGSIQHSLKVKNNWFRNHLFGIGKQCKHYTNAVPIHTYNKQSCKHTITHNNTHIHMNNDK